MSKPSDGLRTWTLRSGYSHGMMDGPKTVVQNPDIEVVHIDDYRKLEDEVKRLREALQKIETDFIPNSPKQFELSIQEMRECASEALANRIPKGDKSVHACYNGTEPHDRYISERGLPYCRRCKARLVELEMPETIGGE